MQSTKISNKLKKASVEAKNGNYLKSLSLCKSIIKKEKINKFAYKLLVTNLIALNRYSEVEVALKKVIPHTEGEESAQLSHLLGCNYISLKDNVSALNVLETVFNESGDCKILLDIALAYYNLGNYEAARDVYLKLLEFEPNNHQAKFNLYPILLHFKDYKNAWACFHSRLERQEMKDQVHWFASPWSGESLVGKNILIYPEQGIGDNLYYTGCFSEAIADAKHTHIVCDNRLKALYKQNFPTATIYSYEDVNSTQTINGDLDLQILVGSLPYLYRQTACSFSNNKKLTISDCDISEVNERLTTKKLRIGLSWFHGRINDGNEHSMYLEDMLPLLKINGIEWINLQFGEWHEEVKSFQSKHGISITHIEECSAAGDFNDYGSLIANLDLVISASNAALMLASRLGVKNWMFLVGKEQQVNPNTLQDTLSLKNSRTFYKNLAPNWDAVINSFCDELNALPELKKRDHKT